MDDNLDLIKVDIVDSSYKTLLSSSEVRREGDRLMLHGKNFPILPPNIPIKIIGYNKEGILTMHGSIDLSIKEQVNITLDELGDVSDRRNYIKVRTKEEATIRLSVMGRSKIGLKVDDPVRLRDISLGGVCFFSNGIYLKGQVLVMEFHEIKPGFMLAAKILRKSKEEAGRTYRHRYACQFVNTDDIQERILLQHVFKTELINYQKEVE